MRIRKTNDESKVDPRQEVISLEIMKMVHNHFLQDLRDFWSRSNFYLVVQAGLLSVFVSQADMASQYSIFVSIGLASLGFVLAFAWFFVMRGAIHWIRRWRAKLVELDELIDPHKSLATIENEVISSPLWSPSSVTSWLPILFIIVWPLLIFNVLINR